MAGRAAWVLAGQGGAGLLGWWAGEREGLIQAAGTEGGGRPVGREAERGPYRFVDIRVVTRTSGRVGVPVPQERPRRRPHHSHLGFLCYYSFHFGVTFDFLSNSRSDTIHIPRNSPFTGCNLMVLSIFKTYTAITVVNFRTFSSPIPPPPLCARSSWHPLTCFLSLDFHILDIPYKRNPTCGLCVWLLSRSTMRAIHAT